MRLRDFQDVADATDVQTLQDQLVRFANDIGFGLISAALVVDTQVSGRLTFGFGNTPEAYAPIWDSNVVGRRDPVVRRLKRASAPFAYDQSMYVTEEAADLWKTQAQFGYKTGIATAFHLPKATHFFIGVDRERALPDDEELLTRMMGDLQLIAVHAMDAAIRHFTPPTLDLPLEHCPTKCELEVLRWTLAGKTAWEVGMLLNISERTAAIHANRAAHKLECVSKHQAALKAMQLGLI